MSVAGIGFGLQSTAVADDSGADGAAAVERIDFSEQVLPLLRRHCFRCHGEKNQEASLRLDRAAAMFTAADSGIPIVVPGDPNSSLIVQRVSGDQLGDQMPPDSPPLPTAEIELLRAWIAQGGNGVDDAPLAEHWAYRPIVRPAVPRLSLSDNEARIGSPIDAFVRDELLQQGLSSTPRDVGHRLLRRASLVLTGLPPTVEQLDAFLQDQSPFAYEKAVDQLLASEQFGQRWATPWLDLARYADSNGFQADQIRDNWAYRDWLIRALNSDMPFDQFVIEQLAGDLLPNATIDQRVATGFHRMTTCNVEAGVDPEANRVSQVVDRVNTTGTVFLGTTFECAQCHDHKYDPFTQEDYYQLFAYFNNTPLEVKQTSGVTWDFYGPVMELPLDPSQQQRRVELKQKIDALDWQPATPESFASTGNELFAIQDDGAVLIEGPLPDKAVYTLTFSLDKAVITELRLDALTDPAIPGNGPGRGDPQRTNFVLHEISCELVDGTQVKHLTLADPKADFSQAGWDVAGAIDGDPSTGWAINPQFGKPHWASFRFTEPIIAGSQSVRLRITLVQHYGQGRVIGKPRISFRGTLHDDVDSLKQQFAAIQPATTLVMEELPEVRQTYVMLRGDYEQLGKAVKPGTPTALPRLTTELRADEDCEEDAAGTRLELARWLVSRDNPLLARVTVNRWWGQIFGRGLVTTPEDFGTQAEPPTHPELLDWLACELMDSNWSMKHVIRQIVLSDTFCQSATCSDAALESDPTNRLLARGPRYRLDAETIRDNALAISGVLSNKMYGPPVMPHQPAGLWRSVGRNQPKWVAAEDENRFRRGLYVVFKRASPYPSFMNFDTPDRGSCTVQRATTNTPLQALTLLNDPAYVELALAFADRVLNSSLESDRDRLKLAMRMAISRDAEPKELDILEKVLEDERGVLKEKPHLIEQRINPRTEAIKLTAENKLELAAWYAVTSVLLNLDETINL